MPSRKKITVILMVLFVVLLATTILVKKSSGNIGSAEVVFQLPDVQHISAKINGRPLSIQGLDTHYVLAAGKKQLVVTKPGYAEFSTTFTLKKGQAVIINIFMKPDTQQAPATATKNLTDALTHSLAPGFLIQQSVYFYDNTWAVVQVSNGSNTAILVAQYNLSGKSWEIVLGPGTFFDSTSLKRVPADVASYMYAQHFATHGSFSSDG